MGTERSTFHESWYRVAQLTLRLAASVQVSRQRFRGQLWYVLENPATNEFSRLSRSAYDFIALLDGNRTIAQAWQICNARSGDQSPTQTEAIQLLARLFTANLLQGELPPDSRRLFNRYRQRIIHKIQGFMANFFFMQIPLLDPDPWIDRCVGLCGRFLTRTGLAVWLVLVSIGLLLLVVNKSELARQSMDVLAPGNLIWLYLSLVTIKILHEFGHAIVCKTMAAKEGVRGAIHRMGIMILVFIPVPFVDTSSAWAFRSKRRRTIVGLAGMMSDLLIAALAMIFWTATSTGMLHILAFNIIFIAGVSTLLFNGNPLLRFDAYYVLSDLLEIPNLCQRSKEYIYYLVKRYAWGLRNMAVPAYSRSERIWLGFYGIGSGIYRILVSLYILVFLNDRIPEELFILVPVLAAAAAAMWVIMPAGRFICYLFGDAELERYRTRAIHLTAGTVCALLAFGVLMPLPDYVCLEGIVEPVDMAVVYAKVDGFVDTWVDYPVHVSPTSPAVLQASNRRLQTEKLALSFEKEELEIKKRLALLEETAVAQIYEGKIKAIEEKIDRVNFEMASLQIRCPISGMWIPSGEIKKGAYIKCGQNIGYVGSLDRIRIRAIAGQAVVSRLLENHYKDLEIRAKNRPHDPIKAAFEAILPAGLDQLPSQSLGYTAGGSIATQIKDQQGLTTAERFFEIRIKPQKGSLQLYPGQRVISRVQLPAKPLVYRGWLAVCQLFQRRYHI